ncbi:MAG TPA: TonB family protein [Bryobacteraceae bacterium]|nr:TonB family protein [Bryobacteraceae bacterium]
MDDGGQGLRPDGFWRRRDEYIVWRAPSVSMEVRFSVLAIGRLALERELPPMPGYSGEGVLLGHKHPRVIVIEECSPQGREAPRAARAERRSARQGERAPAGWYQMAPAQFSPEHLAAELCDRRDLHGRQVILFVHTDWVDGSVATACLLMDGKIAARSPVLALDGSATLDADTNESEREEYAPAGAPPAPEAAPVQDTVLRAPPERDLAPRPPMPPLERPSYETAMRAPKPARSSGWRAALPWTIGGLALVLALVSSLLQYRTARLLQPGDTNARSPLGLDSVRNGAQLRLTWNGRHPAILGATGGKLTILDGPIRKEIELSAGELQNGSVVYSPATNDLSVRLEVIDGQRARSVSETVRLLAGPWPELPERLGGWNAPESAVATPLPPVRRRTRDAVIPDEAEREARRAPTASPLPIAAAPLVPPTAPAAQQTAPPPVTPPATQPAPPAAQPVTEASSSPQNPPPNFTRPVVVSRQTETSPLRLPEPARTQAPLLTPAPKAPSTEPAPPPRQSDVRPAVLVQRVEPVFPPAARSRSITGTVVLSALIGKDGRLRNVRAIDGPPLFRPAAEAAVRQWKYRPTLLNGQPIENEIRIQVQFMPGR